MIVLSTPQQIKLLLDLRKLEEAYAELQKVYEDCEQSNQPVAKEYVELHLLAMTLESEV